MNPAISVVMAVYNGEAYLSDAIKSILSQTFGDFEFIIVDDGCVDSSAKIIDSFSDARIVKIDNGRNMGLIASLNKAISIAKGRYIARMDADDISYPIRFMEQFEHMEVNSRVAVVGAWHQVIDHQNRPIHVCRFPKTSGAIKANLIFTPLSGWTGISHPTVMIRREILDEVGLYDPECTAAEDYDLWLRILRKHTIENITKILLEYRLHDASVTGKHAERMIQSGHAATIKNLDYYMPKCDPRIRTILGNMLCNNRQDEDSDIKALFLSLDDYFYRIFSDELNGANSDYFRRINQELKVLYIPKLVMSHSKEAFILLFKSLFSFPEVIFTRKFISATVKNYYSALTLHG